jgi:sugar/nucleoside kinase (ribokinase family)
MSGLDPSALARLFAEVRRRGVQTVLDVVLPGPGDHWPRLAPVLAQTDVFHANVDEARAITGLADSLAQAERFRAAGARVAVVTSGEAGTVLVTDRLRLRAAAYPAEFVGGTGAGDAFDAGFIVGLLEGEDETGCLRWGSALGASCVRAVGATESVFNRTEAEVFMRQHELRIERLL